MSAIKPKNKTCIECGSDKQPWYSKRRCKMCASKSYAKATARNARANYKPTGEREVFLEKWNSLEPEQRLSWLSGRPIYRFNVSCFAHLAAKGEYEYLRLEPENIVLVTMKEHWLQHYGTIKQKDEYAAANGFSWEKFEEAVKQILVKFPKV